MKIHLFIAGLLTLNNASKRVKEEKTDKEKPVFKEKPILIQEKSRSLKKDATKNSRSLKKKVQEKKSK